MVKALTVRTIETIKPGATRQEIPDGFVRGLYYVIQPSGARSWALRYRSPQRESRKLTIGRYPGIGLKDARELASRALVAVASGGDPAFDKQAAKTGAKRKDGLDFVENVVERFLERYVKPNVRPSSAKEYDRVLHKEVVARWKGRRLSELGRADIHEMLDQVVDRGSPVQANRVLAAVRKLCSWSIERGLIETSPCAGIKPPTSETSRDRVMSNDEVVRIARSCDALGYPFGHMVKLLLLTGQRRNEVADMTWAEIDLDAKVWTIPRTRAKNGNEHPVPLSPQALSFIDGLPRIGDRFLFTTNGKSPVSGFSKAKIILDKQIGSPALPHWTFHDLRRTAATGMARLGVTLPTIEKVLNHISGSFGGIVGVYQHHGFADEKRHALDAWGAFVERLVTMEPGANVVEMKAAG